MCERVKPDSCSLPIHASENLHTKMYHVRVSSAVGWELNLR